MPIVLDELVALLTLERIEQNLFRGQSQDLGWGTVFGGQVLGQALSAAAQTVPDDRRAHSLHAYFLRPGDVHKPIEWLATDHGKPPLDQRSRKLPQVYVKLHDQYYKDTSLRHQQVDSSFAYYGRDLFSEMREPASKRGMRRLLGRTCPAANARSLDRVSPCSRRRARGGRVAGRNERKAVARGDARSPPLTARSARPGRNQDWLSGRCPHRLLPPR